MIILLFYRQGDGGGAIYMCVFILLLTLRPLDDPSYVYCSASLDFILLANKVEYAKTLTDACQVSAISETQNCHCPRVVDPIRELDLPDPDPILQKKPNPDPPIKKN